MNHSFLFKDMSLASVPGGITAISQVLIVDFDGTPMAQATVNGEFDGIIQGAMTGVTDASGRISFTSRKTKKDGVIGFTVTSVIKSGYRYDASLNRETSDSISTATPVNQAPVAVILADPISGTPPLTVSFDAMESYDPDGSIVSYAWDFGDGTSDTRAVVQHLYEIEGAYEARLTVTDDQGATHTAQVSIQAFTPGKTLSVSNIAMALETLKGGRLQAQAQISVLDSDGVPAFGATVSGTWSGLTSGSVSGVTDGDGNVLLVSGNTKKTGIFTFTVQDVTKPGHAYDPALNIETTDSISH